MTHLPALSPRPLGKRPALFLLLPPRCGGWAQVGRGWGLTAPSVSQSPAAFCITQALLCPHHAHRFSGRHRHYPSPVPDAARLRVPWATQSAERGQKILRLLGAACGIRGCSLHVSDSFPSCSQPEDRGQDAAPGPLFQGASDTLHSDPVGWRLYHLMMKTEVREAKVTCSGSQGCSGGVRLYPCSADDRSGPTTFPETPPAWPQAGVWSSSRALPAIRGDRVAVSCGLEVQGRGLQQGGAGGKEDRDQRRHLREPPPLQVSA